MVNTHAKSGSLFALHTDTLSFMGIDIHVYYVINLCIMS